MLLDPWHSVSRSSELYVKMQELTQASIQAEDILKASCNEKALNTYYSQTVAKLDGLLIVSSKTWTHFGAADHARRCFGDAFHNGLALAKRRPPEFSRAACAYASLYG
jgi:hypothetical protein